MLAHCAGFCSVNSVICFRNQFGRDEIENEGLRSQIQTDRWKREKNQKLFLCDLREEFHKNWVSEGALKGSLGRL